MAGSADINLYSTHAKVLMNDWPCLRDILEQNTTPIKNLLSQPTPSLGSVLLTDQQIQDALTGPLQAFFKAKLSAYASIATVRFMLTIIQDDNFKQTKNVYPKEALQKLTPADLDKMQQSLDELTKTHYQVWQEKNRQWVTQLIFTLSSHDAPLSDIEIREFQDQEPLSQLLARLTDLHLDIDKPKTVGFEQYLRLKAQMAVKSSLGRRHLAHEHHEIHKIFKNLKSDFEKIHEEEKTLLEEQQAQTKKTTEPPMGMWNDQSDPFR